MSQLKDISDNSIGSPLDITQPFATSGTGAVPTDCATIFDNAKGDTNASLFLDRYNIGPTTPLTQKLIDFKNALPTALQETSKVIKDDAAQTAVTTYLDSLENTYIPTIQHVENCLRESLFIDNTKTKKSQDNLDEAKSRLAAITNPEENVSYYEGWFPIVRPMTESALFGLFGAAIFLLLLSIMILLRLTGVQIDITIPEIVLPYFQLPPNASYYIYGGIAVGIIGGLSYAYYLRKSSP